MAKNIKLQLEKMVKRGFTVGEMAEKLKLTELEVRLSMVKYRLVPNSRLEKDYQECAKKLFKIRKKCYFYSEMAQKTGLSLSKTRLVCNLYNIKPSKVCNCIVCGTTIGLKSGKHIPKYCSKRCSNIGFRGKSETKKQIIKVCKVCGVSFEGSPNSKYCSYDCKDFAREVRGGIKCLKGL